MSACSFCISPASLVYCIHFFLPLESLGMHTPQCICACLGVFMYAHEPELILLNILRISVPSLKMCVCVCGYMVLPWVSPPFIFCFLADNLYVSPVPLHSRQFCFFGWWWADFILFTFQYALFLPSPGHAHPLSVSMPTCAYAGLCVLFALWLQARFSLHRCLTFLCMCCALGCLDDVSLRVLSC